MKNQNKLNIRVEPKNELRELIRDVLIGFVIGGIFTVAIYFIINFASKIDSF